MRLLRIRRAHEERLLERVEGALEISPVVPRPADVVEEGREPVTARIVGSQLDAASGPCLRIADEGGHVRGVAGQEPVAGGAGLLEGSFEQRESGRTVSARPQEPASLDEHPALGPAEHLGLGEQALAGSEVAAQSFDSRELSEEGGPVRRRFGFAEAVAKPALAQVEVVEVPDTTPAVEAGLCHSAEASGVERSAYFKRDSGSRC